MILYKSGVSQGTLLFIAEIAYLHHRHLTSGDIFCIIFFVCNKILMAVIAAERVFL